MLVQAKAFSYIFLRGGEMEGNGDAKKDRRNRSNKVIPKKQVPNDKKRKRLLVKYIVTTMIVVVSFFAVSFAAVFGFVVLNGKKNSATEVIPKEFLFDNGAAPNDTGNKER